MLVVALELLTVVVVVVVVVKVVVMVLEVEEMFAVWSNNQSNENEIVGA